MIRVVLVSNPYGSIPEWVVEFCDTHHIELLWKECHDADEVITASEGAEVLWVLGGSRIITDRVLEALQKCHYLLRTGTGTDNIPVGKATELGILVCNTPEATTDTVAEHTIGLMLAVARQISSHDRAVRAGTWDIHHAWPGWHLTGQTLGLIGFGRIARAVAHKISGFDMKVIAYDPAVYRDEMSSLGVTFRDMNTLLTDADYVSLHVPLLEQTHHLISEPQLRLMKDRAILVNTSRGQLIDELALSRALREGWIAGAGIDVVGNPPLKADHELLQHDRLVVTPHIASYDDTYWQKNWEHSMKTLSSIARGEGPIWQVNSTAIQGRVKPNSGQN